MKNRKEKKEAKVGDRVRLRGRDFYGDVAAIDGKWVRVRWLGNPGPGLVHLDELEVVLMYPDDGGLKEPVRKYEETFGIGQVLRKEFFEKKE